MPLAPGAQLGPYVVEAAVGSGGMGEVYRARDTRLDRAVAIKVLPAALAADRQFRERFEREARTVSQFNDPRICTLYDIGEAVPHPPTSSPLGAEASREIAGEAKAAQPPVSVSFLVMEFLEGETLAARIARGPLKIADAIRIAADVAGALNRAHRAGIVHRDVKPANVFLVKTGAAATGSAQVKLLDFGIAKAADPVAQAARHIAVTEAATLPGTTIGTLQYMAPEQLRNEATDARTDIFALGAVLYEMLTGRKAFDTSRGQTGTVAAILESDPPPVSAIRAETPAALDDLVQRCLAKDPEERWQNALDLRHQLLAIKDGAATPVSQPARVSHALPLAAAAIGGIAIGALAVWMLARQDATPAPAAPLLAQFAITLPPGESLQEYNGTPIAISRDGRRIAFAATHGDTSVLYVREIDDLTPRILPGTERASAPFFSPDGKTIGFEAGGVLKAIGIDGSAPRKICDAPYLSGAVWTSDNTIVFVPLFTAGLWTVPAGGGVPVRKTRPDPAKGVQAQLWPHLLPDDKSVLFTEWTGAPWDEARIAVLTIATGDVRPVLSGGFYPRYLHDGILLYGRANRLMAAPFDVARLATTAPAVPVFENISGDGTVGTLSMSVSETGTLAYAPGTPHPLHRALASVTRQGAVTLVAPPSRGFTSPRLSPDGGRLAMWIEDMSTVDVWVQDLVRGTLTRVTSEGGDNHSVAWSPDGTRLAYESSRTGVHNVYVRRADGTGPEERVTTSEHDEYVSDWSSDGKTIAFTQTHPDTSFDIWTVDTTTHTPRVFVHTPAIEQDPAFSPDGHWIAYVSNESGVNEVYVQPFPGPGDRVLISAGGGEEPAWARSGRELFYRNGSRMMVVPIAAGTPFNSGKPTALFQGLYHFNKMPNRTYDVAADGRFIMVKEPDASTTGHQINVLIGWADEVKRRLATR